MESPLGAHLCGKSAGLRTIVTPAAGQSQLEEGLTTAARQISASLSITVMRRRKSTHRLFSL